MIFVERFARNMSDLSSRIGLSPSLSRFYKLYIYDV